MSKFNLRIDWSTSDATKFACDNWHYSKCSPIGKANRIGAWEDGLFVGVMLFIPGASPSLGKPYGIENFECCELARIAMREHKSPVTRMLRIALSMLKKKNPRLRLVVSFADQNQNHHGGVYQGGNWIYAGETSRTVEYYFRGKWRHPKTFRSEWSNLYHIDLSKLKKRTTNSKHRYLMPLDEEMRKQIEPLRKPYPKRVRSIDADAPANHAGEGGSIPTRTLQNKATP